jgi:hypothetical protein
MKLNWFGLMIIQVALHVVIQVVMQMIMHVVGGRSSLHIRVRSSHIPDWYCTLDGTISIITDRVPPKKDE